MIPRWIYLLLVLCVVQVHCEIYQDRPKIKTLNGDLILEPAVDKSIYLRPNGPKSSIFIGNINILKTNSSNYATQYPISSNENVDKYFNGPDGVLQRLERLENKGSVSLDSALLNITMLWRKVKNLNRKILALQNQINSRPKDECDSSPCQHGATCLNLVDGYHCLCPSNWEGKDCDIDVNECRNFAGTDLGCQNGATCINRPGTYECLCKSGWYGLHCTRKAKDCTGGDFEMCGYGSCIPVTSGEGIKCICHQGWTSNATSVMCLTDVNECDSYQVPRCSVNPRVECINLPGSFRCGQCPAGYEGDGYVCNDIDECITIPNGGCSPMVTCHNTIGSRICGTCPPGYQGDGVTCTLRVSCVVNNGGCHPLARCVENSFIDSSPTRQAAHCICPEGMNGDGVGLLGCHISSGGCENNPCGNHGQCHLLRSGYTCICDKGYSGAHCESQIASCADNPCHNGGTCRQDDTTISGFRCECSAQYSGSLCQVRSEACGGILDAEEGTIAYPLSNTSKTYNHNAQCAWVIHTALDKVINVTFAKFNVEWSSECWSDFLQIHDGRKSSNQLLGRFCGNTLPRGGNIISSHNNLYLWFHSDRTIAKAGFTLHWTSIKPICGGEINVTTHGQIMSPGSPGPYPPNRDCYWHLAAVPGKRISLYFFALDIEAHNNCSYDYLAVYDGEHVTDPLLSRYCNSTHPAPVQSASSDILIHFHSDAYESGNGFQIVYAPINGVPGCGGYFTANKGEIVSPTYNGMYLTNLLCEYKIKTTIETKIKIEFKLFKLERSFRCQYDYLKIYDGPSSDSQLVGTFCGTVYPTTYTSSSNNLFLKFKTDQSMAADGFRITYEAVCEKTLLGDSGIITSPAYPFSYPNKIVCVYVITTEPGKAIQLTFQDFNIGHNRYTNCQYDNIEIRDGAEQNSPLLGKYCGGSEHIPPVKTSTFNYMYVRFQSDRLSTTGTGFYANYTTIDTNCGGIFRGTTGLINHPSGEASTYQNDQECQWLLLAPEGMHIKITWNRFEIEDSPGCGGDYLKLIEINNKNENDLLGKYCGNHPPPALTTSTNRLKLNFNSDSEIRHAGFSISYTFLDERTHCGGNYIKSHGTINSPGWPKSYEPNRDCTWIITVPAGQQISLNISNFDLERPIRGKCNLGDYLEIRNGGSQTSPLIGQYCGKFASMKITSLANVLHIHFHSDFYLTGTGFKIEWDGTITGCGGILTSSSGSISSPNYPNDYHENSECFYRIITSAGSRIRITFTELDLERTPNCRDDYVEIYDGRETNVPSLGNLCQLSTETANIETTANYALIKFRSDLYISGKGFMLHYNTICNNNITGRYGVIESPDYPNNYPLNLKCQWNIQVPKGNKINVTFTHFDIYQYHRLRWMNYRQSRVLNEGDCYPDYLQMKDLSDPNAPKKLCGNSIPNTISTKGNTFQIQFASGFYAPRTGFRLEWVSSGCGGHVLKQSGTISLDSSLTTDKEMECEWLIEAPPAKSIIITFIDIYMSESKNCSTDAIEVYNGQNTKSPLLSKICHQTHVSIQSDSNFMLIRFKKQSSLKDVHFSSQFYSLISKCGGFVNSMSGFFFSKNYPNNYDNNLDCIWYITVAVNHRIEINFMDLDLYSNYDIRGDNDICSDTILIYDTEYYTSSSNYTYRICPNSNTTGIVTKYNQIVVQFKTDSDGTAKGFKANFTTACGALISAKQDGIITNNRFINHSNKSCIWTIVSPALDQKISLTITHMSLEKDSNVITNRNCPSAFLRVLDGDDENAPLIDEYCGRKVPPMIVSHGNAITILFGSYTDKMVGTFSAHYSPITNACGGTITSEEGTIASPSYPSPYPANADCEWIINTSTGNNAYIVFENFNLEYSEDCNEDYLEMRENDSGGKLLGVYCGSDIPTNFTKASQIYVKFHSNSGTNGKGFMLHYGYLHENDIHGNIGEISSPLYPAHYEGAGEFKWHIFTSGVDGIVLTISELEISSYSDTIYNRLTIYDGYDNTAAVLEQLHGALSDKKIIQSSSNVLCIVLIMDDSNTGSMFHLTWTSTIGIENRINCGSNKTEMVLPGATSIVTSPNYPEEYGFNLNCQWTYKTQAGRYLSITFTEINLEEVYGCYADTISIYSADSPGNWRPIKESICQSTAVSGEINSSVYMKINFKTDAVVNKKGFLGLIRSKCGGLITDLSGEVGPLWGDVYTSYGQSQVKCNWTIKVRPGRTIQLKFSYFNITNRNGDCLTSVVLRNGDSIEAPLLENGKYCGYEHEKKSDIVTSSNSLFVSFTSQSSRFSFVFQSFKIYYEEKNYECGSTSKLTGEHKWELINSPNYPSIPDAYSECIWVFSSPPGEIIRIDFIDRFDLDNTDDCGTEVVEVRDGSTNLSPIIGQLCHDTPATIKSSSNTIYIKYSTQLSVPRNGFKANVSIDICGGTIITESGEVTSPGYPQMKLFPLGTVCEWHIVGPQGHVFLISLEDVNLPNSQSSSKTKIDIEEKMPINNTINILKTITDYYIPGDAKTVETSSNQFTIKLTFGKPEEWESISDNRGFRLKFNSSRPQCGGQITTSEGYLTTPGYPQYTTLKYCRWRINVPNKLRRIRLEIIDSDQEKHTISLFNDAIYHSVIETIPNDNSTSDNQIFESVGNKLAILISLNRFASSHRFKARFSSDEQALCGGELNGISQELVSPELQRAYSCDWHYNNQALTENQKNLTYNTIFITVSINSSATETHCLYYDPHLIINSPLYDRGIVIRREFCASTETSLRIPLSTLDINALKWKTNYFYFHLNIKFQPCGGLVHVGEEPVNIINTPDFYNDTLDCAWILVIPADNRVEISMSGSFLLECSDEYVTIKQSFYQHSPVIGTYCKGEFLDSPLVAHYSFMYIQYHSNVKGKTDVNIIVKTVTNQCGGLFTSYSNVFASPNYPKAYNPNQECVWEIRADLGYRVSLQFVGRFSVESNPNCTKDVVIIYDWEDKDYKEMARVCGREALQLYNSTHNRLKVVFRTDAETNLDGFKAQWTPICGGKYVVSETERILYSPGFPNHYPRSIHCTYELSTPNKEKILLKFLEFELQGYSPDCMSDNLTVTSQNDYTYLYQIHCDKKIPATLRSYTKLNFDFKTDSVQQKKGFKLSYSIFKCGGTVNESRVITPMAGNDNYDENMNCTWFITAPPTKIIVVKFLYIDLESSSECYKDYVALYDGVNADIDKRLAVICGFVNSTTVLRSTENKMVLEFISDYGTNYKGFKAQIYFTYSAAAGCGGKINITGNFPVVLKSPLMGGSLLYENFLDCHWSITSPPDTTIQITFTKFHLAPCQNLNQTAIGYSKCDCDLVEIKDGLNPNSLVIGTYCGHTFPPQLITSRNAMSLRLSTDGEITSSGFEATLTVEQTVCGQTFIPVTSKPRRFKSPGYDTGSIPRGLNCVYQLDTNSDQYIQVRITVIDLQLRPPSTENSNINYCNKDRLVISSVSQHTNRTIGKDLVVDHREDFFSHLYFYELTMHFPDRFELCGQKQAIDLYVSGSASINLITSSDTDNEDHKGVEIEVVFVALCDRNYSEPQGRIKVSYAQSFEIDIKNIDCYTLITAPENHTISAYFIEMSPVYWDLEVYLEIYDGNKPSGNPLIKVTNQYSFNNNPIFSTGRYLLLHNHQNNNNRVTFDMNYVTTDKGRGCGGKINNIVGAVTSPLYPETYRHENTCEWELETPVGTKILLRFSVLDLGLTCDENYLELVDSKGFVVRSYCSELPADYTSNDNYVKLVFHTTMNNSGKGWTALFVGLKI